MCIPYTTLDSYTAFLEQHASNNFLDIYGISCACINSGSQAVFLTAWVRGSLVPGPSCAPSRKEGLVSEEVGHDYVIQTIIEIPSDPSIDFLQGETRQFFTGRPEGISLKL